MRRLYSSAWHKQRYILEDVIVGLLIALLLIGAKIFLEQLSIGHRIEILIYEFLQGQLSPFTGSERLPILVIDMGNIPGGKDQVTSRNTLESLLRGIVNEGPKAVAIDADFSPNEAGWLTDDDPEFFDFCLKIGRERNVPIFLGVYRSSGESADTWLGLEKYKRLAVSLFVQGEDTSRMPRWIPAKNSSEVLPTLGSALAQAHKKSLPAPPKWLAWALEMPAGNEPRIDRHTESETKDAEVLMNYSKLAQIEHETLRTISPISVAESGDLYRDKMVIIGDATQFTDSFIVPGRKRPVAGVYLQACAAYTLAIEPLHEFKSSIRFGLDLMISSLIILSVAYFRFRHINESDDFPWHKAQSRFLYVTVILIFVAGVLLMRWLSVMWLDFLLVVFALLLHPSVDHWFDGFKKRWRGKVAKSTEHKEERI